MNTTEQELAKLGSYLRGLLDTYIRDRALHELQWLKNLRQYMGKYDPEVEQRIPVDRSHAYPRDTRTKVKGGVAKMMEMMFPAQEINWELVNSPIPSIPREDLQRIIDALKARVDEQGNQIPPSSDEIERAVREFADGRRVGMQKEIEDQLADPGTDYPQLCKRVVRNGYIYGFGVARCPMVREQKERVWEFDETLQQFVAKIKTVYRPYPEFVRIWDVYMDLSAKMWTDQEAIFERWIFNRHDFRKLMKRKDFMADVIREYLKEHTEGNYTPQSFETELRLLDKTSNLLNRESRRYEAYRCLGFISAHTLHAAGIPVKESEMDTDILADVWFIDNTIIKARVADFGERPSDQYHAFIYAEDEDSGLVGVGLPEEVRDSQMSLCASTRATYDNMAATAGPIYEVNEDLLPPGVKDVGTMHSFKVIHRVGDGAEAQYPAVRDISTESHIAEIMNVTNATRQQLDIESNLPAYTMGAVPQQPLGEAFRTSYNMSTLTGASNMLTKDNVRAFDKFTTSLVGSMLMWNMEFNPKEEIKGDYQVRAKGNISLVAKEIRGAALDQFMSTLDDKEKAALDRYGILLDRMRARDLSVERVYPREKAQAIWDSMDQAASEAASREQALTDAKTADVTATAQKKQTETQMTAAAAEATINEIISRVEMNLALAKSAEDKTQLENLKTLLSTALQNKGAAV